MIGNQHYQRNSILRQRMAKVNSENQVSDQGKTLGRKVSEEGRELGHNNTSPNMDNDVVNIENQTTTQTTTSGSEYNFDTPAIFQSVTLSYDEDASSPPPSPLSKAHSAPSSPSYTPLPAFDANSSVNWAMMERYDDENELEQEISHDEVTLATQVLMELARNTSEKNGETTSTTDFVLHKTPARTPKPNDWRKLSATSEQSSSTPGSLLRADIISTDDDSDHSDTDSALLDTNSPSKFADEHARLSVSSPFSAFKQNTSDVDIVESKAYVRRIMELQQELKASQAEAQEELRRREAAEDKCQQLQGQLMRVLSTSSFPKTPQNESQETHSHPQTPATDSLWERNKTLVKEVRFADQTCVELSAQKLALEKQVNSLQDQLKSASDKISTLKLQISEHVKFEASTKAQCHAAENRVTALESDVASTKSLLERSQQQLAEKTEAHGTVTKQHQAAEERARAAESELSLAKNSLLHAEQRVSELQSDLASSKRSLEQSERLHSSLAAQIERQYHLQSTSPRESDTNLSTITEERDQLAKELNELKRRMESQARRVEEILQERDHGIKAAQAMSRSMERAKQDAEKKLEEERAHRQSKESALVEIRQKLDEAEIKKDNLQAEVDSLAKDHDQALASATKEIEFLKAGLEHKARDIEAIQNELARSQEKCDELKRQQSALRTDRDHLSAEADELRQQQGQFSVEAEQAKSDLMKSEKELKAATEKLVYWEHLAAAAKEESSSLVEAAMCKAESLADKRVRDIELKLSADHQAEKSKLQARHEGETRSLKEKLRLYESDVNNLRASVEKLKTLNVQLQQDLSDLNEERDALQKLLEKNKSEMAAELERKNAALKQKDTEITAIQGRLTEVEAESQNVVTLLAESIKAAAEELDSQRVQMDENAEVAFGIICNRIASLSEKVETLQAASKEQESSCDESIATRKNERSCLAPSSPSLNSNTSEQNWAGQHSSQSVLLGASLLSPPQDGVPDAPTTSPNVRFARNLASLDMTRDLEQMEEAREPTTPVSTIGGMSNWLNSTFLVESDMSPAKTPLTSFSQCDIQTEKVIQHLEAERDKAIQIQELLRNELEQLKAKIACNMCNGAEGDPQFLVDNAQPSVQELAKLEEARHLAETKCDELKKELILLRSDIRSSEERIACLENKLQQERGQITQDQDELSSLRAERKLLAIIVGEDGEDEAILGKVAKLHSAYSALCSTHAESTIELSREIDLLRAQLREKQDATSVVATETDQSQKIAKMKQEYAELCSTHSEATIALSKEIELLQAEIEAKSREITDLHRKLRKEKGQVDGLSNENKSLRDELTRLRGHRHGLSLKNIEETDILRTKISEIEAENDKLSAEVSEHFRSRLQASARCERLSAENKDLREALVQASEKGSSTKRHEAEAARDALERKTAELEAVEAQRAKLRVELDVATRQIHELQDTGVSLRQKLERATTEEEQKTGLVCDLQRNVDALQQNLAELTAAKEEIARLVEALEASDKKLEQLKESFVACNDKLVESAAVQKAQQMEIELATKRAFELEAQLSIAQMDIETERHGRESAENAHKSVAAELGDIKKELCEYKEIGVLLQRKEAEIADTAASKEAATEQLHQLEHHLQQAEISYQNEINQLKEELEHVVAANSKLETRNLELEEEGHAKSCCIQNLEDKCRRLKEYARKLTRKCEEWEEFYEKQASVVAELRSEYKKSIEKADKVSGRARQLRQKEKLYKQQLEQLSAERTSLCLAKSQLEEEVACLAREILLPLDIQN